MPIIGNLWLFVILNETSLCEPLWVYPLKNISAPLYKNVFSNIMNFTSHWGHGQASTDLRGQTPRPTSNLFDNFFFASK